MNNPYISNITDEIDALNTIRNIKLPEEALNFENHFLADYQYKLLCKYIKDFQDTLDENHEVGLQLASFGQSLLLNVTSISYSNPSIIDFYGYYNGNKAHLIQNINQLNFLLLSVPKLEPSKPARRIGFDTNLNDDLND